MRILGAVLLILLGTPPQDGGVECTVETKDGQSIIGFPLTSSIKVASSLGDLDLQMKNLETISFGASGWVEIATRDRSKFTGRSSLTEFKTKTRFGEVAFKLEAIKIVRLYPPSTASKSPAEPTGKETFVVEIGIRGGNRLNGTTDLGRIEFESSVGTFTISLLHISKLRATKKGFELHMKDSGWLLGKPKVGDFKIRTGVGEFTVKEADLESLNIVQVNDGAAEAPVKNPAPGPPPGPSPAPPPGPAAARNPGGVSRSGHVPLSSAMGELRTSPDGTRLYGVNLSDGKLCRWKLPGLEADGTVMLTGVEKAIAFDPSGKTIWVGGQRMITLVDPQTMTVKKSFSIEVTIEDICAVDPDTLLAVGVDGSGLISISKTAVVQKYMNRGSRLSASPDGKRIYSGDSLFALTRKQDGSAQVEPRVSSAGVSMTGELGAISPDGRYSCSALSGQTGNVFRLGKCWAAGKVLMMTVERHTASAFSPDSKLLYLVTEEGFLKIYDVPGFTVKSAHSLAVRATQAFVTPDGASIIVAAQTGPADARARTHNVGALVDLVRFEIPK